MLFIMFVPDWLSQGKDRIFLYIFHLFYSNKWYEGYGAKSRAGEYFMELTKFNVQRIPVNG